MDAGDPSSMTTSPSIISGLQLPQLHGGAGAPLPHAFLLALVNAVSFGLAGAI